MIQTLGAFRKGLATVYSFLEGAHLETELVKSLRHVDRQSFLSDGEKRLIQRISAAATNKRQYVYAVAIISLYGLLERFVDDIILEYMATIPALGSGYHTLPESLRANHVKRSTELLKLVTEDRHRGNLDVESIVSNLHSCLSGGTPFTLNGHAFIIHRGNIRLDKINDFLSELGIEASLRRILLTPAFETYFLETDNPREVRSVSDPDVKLALSPIDDLVERRNSISHGFIDDIEDVDLLFFRCRFLAVFSNALQHVLRQEAYRLAVAGGNYQCLGQPINVFRGKIVCFDLREGNIAVGNEILASTDDNLAPFSFGKVLSIEVDHIKHTSLKCNRGKTPGWPAFQAG